MHHPSQYGRLITWWATFVAVVLISTAEPRQVRSEEVPNLATRRQGVDWPVFLGPSGDNKSSEKGPLIPWSAAQPRILWQLALGTGYAAPTISRGRLFQFSRFEDRARLDCVQSETGRPLWNFEYTTLYDDLYGYDNGPRCCPVVDDDRVYLFGPEGMLHCLSVLDGKLLWKLDTTKKFGVVQNFFGVGSTPVVEQNLLIAQIGGSPPESQKVPPRQLDLVVGNGSGIVAFDKFTGDVKYQLSDELASYSSPTLATIQGRRWCFVFARGGLVGFDPATGKQDFHFPWRDPNLESVNASNPVVIGDQVLISETYGPGAALLKVRPGHYDLIWSDADKLRNKSLQTHWNTPIYVDGYVYGSSGRHSTNAELRCVEWATGRVLWSEPDLSRSSLLYVDGHLVCLTEYGELLLLKVNPQRMEVVARKRLPDRAQGPLPPGVEPRGLLNYPCWAAPILSHGLMYVRGEGRLVCLELMAESK